MTTAKIVLELNQGEAQLLYHQLWIVLEDFWDNNDPNDEGDLSANNVFREMMHALEPFVMSIDDSQDALSNLKGE